MKSLRRRRAALWCLVLLLVIGGVRAAVSRQASENVAAETKRLAAVLEIKPGTTVAEIGAGGGEITVAVARLIGPDGRAYSTELDKYRLRDIKNAVDGAGLQNVKVVEGDERKTNLPAECCDAIFMRRVYHHLTHPADMDASLMASLRPGGRLAVVDFPPRGGQPPPGVPADRGGHGVSADIVVRELTAAGFEHVRTIRDWPGNMYLALFRKK